MPDYRPIPIPLKQRWRDFRTRIVPVLTFVVAVGAMAWLWDQQAAPRSMTGEIHAPVSQVSAVRDGLLMGEPVGMLDQVEANQVLARIRIVPTEQATRSLNVLREEIKMIQLGVGDPVLDQQRNFLSWQGLRRDWLLGRSDLASLRVRRAQAKADFDRIRGVAETGAESISALENAQSIYEALVAEEKEKTKLVDSLARAVHAAEVPGEPEASDLSDGIRASLDWKEAQLLQLEAELEPVELSAPFSGRVTRIFRHPGDFVALGEPIFEIRSSQPEAIIGYLKQPAQGPPKVGSRVTITSRNAPGSEALEATILEIGPQFEPLQPAFIRPSPFPVEERGLPVRISLPPKSSWIPGEIVDIVLPHLDT